MHAFVCLASALHVGHHYTYFIDKLRFIEIRRLARGHGVSLGVLQIQESRGTSTLFPPLAGCLLELDFDSEYQPARSIWSSTGGKEQAPQLSTSTFAAMSSAKPTLPPPQEQQKGGIVVTAAISFTFMYCVSSVSNCIQVIL